MVSPWTALDRPPLSQVRLARDLGHGPVWSDVRVLASTSSTNSVVAAAARAGEPEGLVVIAEEQTAGRGRLGRPWSAPPRSSLLLSVLLRPAANPATWPLLGLVAATAVADAAAATLPSAPQLKWPNDVLVDGRKLAGILAERIGDAVVVGIGLNVSLRAEELPVDTATSLGLAGGATDREVVAKRLLRDLASRYLLWATGDEGRRALLTDYRSRCATIASPVSVELPDGSEVTGTAVAVDDDGRLVVTDAAGNTTTWSAGDVTHLRPASRRPRG